VPTSLWHKMLACDTVDTICHSIKREQRGAQCPRRGNYMMLDSQPFLENKEAATLARAKEIFG
jgi:hypothetical protein